MTKMKNQTPSEQNPLVKANVFNRMFFWWMKDLFIYGSKHNLKERDLYSTLTEDQSATLKIKLQAVWSQEYASALERNEKPNLWKCLIKIFKWKFIQLSANCFFYGAIQMIQPLLLEQIISYFQHSSKLSTAHACLFVGLCVLLSTINIILLRTAHFGLMRLGLNIRIACSSLIYNKLLRISSSSVDKNTSVSVISLLSTDVARFEMMVCYLPFLFTIPIQLILATCLLYRYVGILAAIIGCSSLIFQSLPVQAVYFTFITKLRAQLAGQIDKRISLISEVIGGIQVIKMYVWENYFVKLVQTARKYEMNAFFKMSYFKSFMSSALHSAHRASIFLVVTTYILQNGLMSVNILIPVAQYLTIIKEAAIGISNLAIRGLVDANTSVKRIENFLTHKELVPNVKAIPSESAEAITIHRVVASWDTQQTENTFNDVNLEIERNKLCVIFGSVGAGKTTLLKLIMGELPLVSGNIRVNGKISYASQDPWLFNGSIRDNIIFGGEYCQDRYGRVVEACALSEDFTSLPFGDKTLVGEKGMSLSGGQCARVSLARAVYREADIYLLDDPLAAVDTRVAKILLENCINGWLREKTRILVTHNIQVLSKAEKIILMDAGVIQYQGSFAEFQSNENYSTYFSSSNKDSSCTVTSNFLDTDNATQVLNLSENEKETNEPKETEELLAKGGTPKSLFFKYVQYSQSYISIIILISSSLFLVSLSAGFDYWTVIWTQNQEFLYENRFENSSISATAEKLHESHRFIYISMSLIISIIISSTIKNHYFHKFALNASKNIHNSMFDSLVSAPLKFFQNNPSGRILNRFSEDTISVDDFLTRTILDTLDCFIIVFAMLMPVLTMSGWHVISLLIFSFFCFKLYKLCVPTIRGTKRLAGAAISPILSFVNSSFVGMTTIRSHNAEQIVNNDFDERLDRFTAAHFLHIASEGTMRTWIDLFVPILFGIVAYSSFVFKDTDNIAGYVGLSIMQVSNVSILVSYLIKALSETLSYAVNLERMFEFTKLEQESADEKESHVKPPLNWPTKGELKFDHLFLRYSNNDAPVLQDINLTIQPGMKVGIVGRTGAGKSSLISALFRTVTIDGTILIDGIDTKELSLPELRSKISIIPQEPIIFSSSLRSNLDPFNEFNDAVLWSALESVELKKSFPSLEISIDRGGQNLSLGQRQLLCLARAIIRNNRILVLDEATANVDHITDTLIQKTIRDQFENCTVLTIAHRLNTVMDNDRIIVMKDGRVAEYDYPHILLQKKGGCLLDMVEQTGASMSQHLKDIAEKAYHISKKEN